MAVKLKEGWGFPLNSKKAHYFVGTRSLCMAWMFFGRLEQGNDASGDNCKGCRTRLEKRRNPPQRKTKGSSNA